MGTQGAGGVSVDEDWEEGVAAGPSAFLVGSGDGMFGLKVMLSPEDSVDSEGRFMVEFVSRF